jgi:hypothetical protein
MKKILSLLIIAYLVSFLIVPYGFTADITSAGAGNWSSTTPDAPWPSGTVPGDGDNVTINHAVVWDIATIPASGALGTLTGTGTLTLDMDETCDSNCAINAATITAGNVAQFIILNGAADTDNEVTITSNINGGSTTGDIAVYMNSKGKLNTNGDITAGIATGAYGIHINDGTYAIGGTGKKITGGATVTAYGVLISTSADGGTITADIYGGTDANYGAGVELEDTAGCVLVGKLFNRTAMAWSGIAPTWNPKAATPDSYISMTADSATSLFYSDIPEASNVLAADTVAGETGTASTSGGGAWGY